MWFLYLIGALLVWVIVFRRRSPRVSDVTFPGGFDFDVVGESHYQQALEQICGGRSEDGHDRLEEALLVPDNNNRHDKNAVRVEIRGLQVGHLSRTDAAQVREWLRDAGIPMNAIRVRARIRGGWDRGRDDRGMFGVRIELPPE